jgi:prepilin-type N-terminal cleavage/methylation domain-containing protein
LKEEDGIMSKVRPGTSNRGFTLTEILVVIGIIVLLISILVPVVSKVRKSAQVASVQAQLNTLVGNITQYQQDFSALPGPLPYTEINLYSGSATVGFNTTATEYDATWTGLNISDAENLVLGLAGGLKRVTTTPPIVYDPSLVGSGANNLNVATPKKHRAYIDQSNLSWRDEGGKKTGHFADGAGAANDSVIPEIVDTFSQRMPILYMRARKGLPATAVSTWVANNNFIYTNGDQNQANRNGMYDLSQIVAYVGTDTVPVTIGEGKSIRASEYTTPPADPRQLPHGLRTADPTTTINKTGSAAPFIKYVYPYDGFAYLRDPSSPDTAPLPRAKDGYVLISAGLDRVYGTPDDITSFGPVNP